jgi:hypothetical protein
MGDLDHNEPLVIRENPFDKNEIMLSGRGRTRFAGVSKSDDCGQEIADLIVHAVNSLASHEARIAELEGALLAFMAASEEPDQESKSPRAVLLANAWAKARAVITKAERRI